MPGLKVIPGVVRMIEFPADYPAPKKLPHVGWSPIRPDASPLFEGIADGDFFYFVHSYVFDCEDESHVAATVTYGESFPAAVLRNNIFGCQFHPEKSDRSGLRLLENFCRWQPEQ